MHRNEALTLETPPNTFTFNVYSTFAHNKLCNEGKRKHRNQNKMFAHNNVMFIKYTLLQYTKKKQQQPTGILSLHIPQLKSPCLIQKDNPHIYFIGFVNYICYLASSSFLLSDDLNLKLNCT